MPPGLPPPSITFLALHPAVIVVDNLGRLLDRTTSRGGRDSQLDTVNLGINWVSHPNTTLHVLSGDGTPADGSSLVTGPATKAALAVSARPQSV